MFYPCYIINMITREVVIVINNANPLEVRDYFYKNFGANYCLSDGYRKEGAILPRLVAKIDWVS